MEKYLGDPRHIEFQVFGDGEGNAIHIGERDCSIQRRHQKVLEEAPSPAISAEERERMGAICAKAMADMGYRGAGTIEFLYENERILLHRDEHPAAGRASGDRDDQRHRPGPRADPRRPAARACRAPRTRSSSTATPSNAASTPRIRETFAPSPGTVLNYVAPGGMHVRVDSGLYAGYKVPPYYDSMIGKLIVYGTTRERCIMRLQRALEEFVLEGMKTTVPLHRRIIRDPEFLSGDYTIKWLEKWLEKNPA